MRHIAMSLLIISVLAFDAVRLDAGAVAQTATQPLGACSLLPKDLVMKVSGAVNKLVLDMPPQEEPVGTSGSACDYADIRLQIDAFSPAFIDQTAKQKKDWVPVPGVGDRAVLPQQQKPLRRVDRLYRCAHVHHPDGRAVPGHGRTDEAEHDRAGERDHPEVEVSLHWPPAPTSSTRRLRALPARVSLRSISRLSPYPTIESLAASTPRSRTSAA